MKKRSLLSLFVAIILAFTLLEWNITPVLADYYLCSGGTETTVSGYSIHTFTTSGTFSCPSSVDITILIVGGGGSGGGGWSGGGGYGGGGGGGGVLMGSLSISSGDHSVVIGPGGAGVAQQVVGNNGGNSSFDSYTAYGGGGGGAANTSSAHNGLDGGSGGGGGGGDGSGGYSDPGHVTQTSQSPLTGYGNNAGYGRPNYQAGGGGGAGSTGNSGDSGSTGGSGIGDGISGSTQYYGKGGNGISWQPGVDNTGNGGDGNKVPSTSPSGGSGIVIISYVEASAPTPTNTSTVTDTPSPTNTSTLADTSTPTLTPTLTITSTETLVPSSTLTPTFTSTSTLAPTITFTPSPTITPMASIIWAPSPFSISIALQNALAAALIAAPPAGSSENVYGVISAQSDGSGGWYISLVNIVGVASPYTGWSALTNGQWSGSMDCSGTEPTWTCDFYNPTSIFGGTGGLVFPWQPGTYAIYGQEGVHHDVNCTGGCALPGDDAVDFVSGDALGSSAMPPYAYAAEAGTVTWSCQGVHNGGLIISGASGKFMYFHLAPGQAAFTLGSTFQQGQQIGRLAYGTFDDTPCGWASQGSSEYHLHFAWYPSGNTFSIGGCILDLITQNWLCGTTTIGILGHLSNYGGSSPAPTPSGPTVTPGGPTLTPVPGQIGPVVGGEHIWNGIIQAVIDFIHTNASAILPIHISSPTLSAAVNNAWSTVMDFGWMIQSLQMIWVLPGLIVWGIMLGVEIVRWIYVGYRFVVGLEPIK